MESIELITPQELAQALRVSKGAIWNWINQGKIKAIKLGRLYRIPKSELQRVLQQGI